MIVVLTDQGSSIVVRRIGIARRLLARLRQGELDRRLAAGSEPESAPALAVHAEMVTRPAQRRQLARDLERVVDAASSRGRFGPRVPLCRDRLRRSERALAALADRLVADGPVSARGVAMTRVLLADGAGPLFQPHNPTDLRVQFNAAREALDVRLP